MPLRSNPQRPMKLPLRLLDRQIINARISMMHNPALIELPILIPIRPEPVPRVIMALISKPHRNPRPIESPKLLDQPIVQLPPPLPRKKRHNLRPSIHKLRASPPTAIHRISQRHLLRITRVPTILRLPHLRGSSLPSKRRHQLYRRYRSHSITPSRTKSGIQSGTPHHSSAKTKPDVD